ncbi:ATP-binding protein [Paenibacillus sp.]|uniref:ATP-binding protein n=1 Tax=Paenibacillus sp. TaxID=58172 RepID=UPI0028110507|nr:ATP-binding protein [Paenibacillus sp.]
MLGFENLLLDFLFIIVSVFGWSFFWADQGKWSPIGAGIFCTAGVLFCMSFPFTVFPGYIYDLRIVPLLIAILYGGVRTGVFVAAALIAYRLYLGGDGLVATLYSYIPIILLAIASVCIMKRASRDITVTVGVLLAFVASVTVSLVSVLKMNANEPGYFYFFAVYCSLVTGCMWMSTYLIETLRDNARMRSELQRSEKMHVLGQLAATIAHEIRNPLTVTHGFIQLLRSRSKNETDVNYLNLALEELRRTETIISDYLTYSKPHTEPMESLNVKEQIRNVASMMEPLVVSNGHAMDVQAEEALYVFAEPKQFSQVLVHFIKNAVEAMHRSGRLVITAYKRKDQVVIRLEDTGCGMSEEQIRRLGNPFYSTKDRGTGLGLMVSYRIIEAMRGSVSVRSEVGKGTVFTITLPSAWNE